MSRYKHRGRATAPTEQKKGRHNMNKWYGSIDNRLMENSKMPTPEVGMGVTECSYSDRHPYEVIAIKDSRHITVRELDWKRIDNNGMSDSQEYEYYSNPENRTADLFLTKQGQWRERYDGRRLGCNCFYIGTAEYYYDYTF